MNVEELKSLLGRPIAFHSCLARITGSALDALFLSQAIYWSGKSTDREDWFWKTQEEWTEETGMSRYEQETARKALVRSGVLVEEKRGIPCKLWFKVNFQILADKFAGKPQTGSGRSHNQDCGKTSDNCSTETTPETIPKKGGLPDWIKRNNDLLLAEAIYDSYPRKEGKKDALKAILKAMQKHPYLFLQERTALWARAKAGTELRFIPLPASWFNAERYNDDPEVWSTTTGSSADTRTQLHLLDELRKDEGNLISQLERSFGKGRPPIEAQLASVRAKMTQIKAKLRL